MGPREPAAFLSWWDTWVGFVKSKPDLHFTLSLLCCYETWLYTPLHRFFMHSDITSISNYIQLFVQQLFQANSKEKKLCITGPLLAESLHDQWIPLTRGYSCGTPFACHHWRHHVHWKPIISVICWTKYALCCNKFCNNIGLQMNRISKIWQSVMTVIRNVLIFWFLLILLNLICTSHHSQTNPHLGTVDCHQILCLIHINFYVRNLTNDIAGLSNKT